MVESVLIANRGEIACRVARTAKRMGLRTVAVYSEADAGALHVRSCDAALALGPAPARESYLAIDRLIAAARETGVDCVHPGYGFLSESADFAEACAAAGLIFVGPPPAAIRAMGAKDRAKSLMEKAGVPIVPGYHGERQEPSFLRQKAYEIGYPVMVKAVAGGGGRGLRRVDRHADFDAVLESARREAQAAFGDHRMLIEKCVTAPRHIEVQVFADAHGRAIHLGERDCSLQRRHQKVIEEAPAPGMTPALRRMLGEAAVRAALAVDYAGAGTVEFIADAAEGLREDRIWFMEMNTRLQVEHPVTEAVTGLDLIEWQFRVAAGEALPLPQEAVRFDGHAVEARIYAEDPARGFVPSAGRLVALSLPTGEGLRVDAGVEAGDTISAHYDPMIAKVIAHAPTRDEALDRLARALARSVVAGPATNLSFLVSLCRSPEYRAGRLDTGLIERTLPALVPQGHDNGAAARGVLRLIAREREELALRGGRSAGAPSSPWDAGDGFQLSGLRRLKRQILLDGEAVVAEVAFGADGPAVTVDGVVPASGAAIVDSGDAVLVVHGGRQTVVRWPDPAALAVAEAGDGLVRAPMHGRLLEVLVVEGDAVTPGQRLAVVEAMKMEHTLTAPCAGTVTDVSAAPGSQVSEGAVLIAIAPCG